MEQLKLLKMISGEELLAEITDENSTHITIKNPVRVVVMPSRERGNPSVGFAPWADFSTEKTFTIHKAHVIVTMTPVDAFVREYQGMFSGIIRAPASQLIIPGE